MNGSCRVFDGFLPPLRRLLDRFAPIPDTSFNLADGVEAFETPTTPRQTQIATCYPLRIIALNLEDTR